MPRREGGGDDAWANSKQNEILYCGYHFDHETGLYHVRHQPCRNPIAIWSAAVAWVGGEGFPW